MCNGPGHMFQGYDLLGQNFTEACVAAPDSQNLGENLRRGIFGIVFGEVSGCSRDNYCALTLNRSQWVFTGPFVIFFSQNYYK